MSGSVFIMQLGTSPFAISSQKRRLHRVLNLILTENKYPLSSSWNIYLELIKSPSHILVYENIVDVYRG